MISFMDIVSRKIQKESDGSYTEIETYRGGKSRLCCNNGTRIWIEGKPIPVLRMSWLHIKGIRETAFADFIAAYGYREVSRDHFWGLVEYHIAGGRHYPEWLWRVCAHRLTVLWNRLRVGCFIIFRGEPSPDGNRK